MYRWRFPVAYLGFRTLLWQIGHSTPSGYLWLSLWNVNLEPSNVSKSHWSHFNACSKHNIYTNAMKLKYCSIMLQNKVLKLLQLHTNGLLLHYITDATFRVGSEMSCSVKRWTFRFLGRLNFLSHLSQASAGLPLCTALLCLQYTCHMWVLVHCYSFICMS